MARRVAGDPLGQLDRGGRGIGPQWEERQRLGLLGRGLGELRAAMADLDDANSGQAVDVALALAVPDGDALAAGDDRRRDPGAVAREVAPKVAVGRGAEFGRRS